MVALGSRWIRGVPTPIRFLHDHVVPQHYEEPPRRTGPTAPRSHPRNVLITGGAGFIGANLCRRLCHGDEVEHLVVLDDLSTGSASNLAGMEAVELVEGSVLDQALVDRLVEGAGAVVHLAARPSVARSLEDPVSTHEVNTTGTLNILEAARRKGRPQVIVASSSSVYGANRSLPAHEDLPPAPLSPYAASKLATEAYAVAYGSSFSLPVLVFRFFNVFGPLQRSDHAYAGVVPTFVSAALHGDPLPVHGDGLQTRDFTFVDSVVGVVAAALEGSVTYPGPVNLAFGGRHSVLDLIAELEKVLGRSLEVTHGPVRTGDVRDSQADQGRLRTLFPHVTPTQLIDGLYLTVEWARSSQMDAARPG
jgi:UDP-glucose 4-epimerase